MNKRQFMSINTLHSFHNFVLLKLFFSFIWCTMSYSIITQKLPMLRSCMLWKKEVISSLKSYFSSSSTSISNTSSVVHFWDTASQSYKPYSSTTLLLALHRSAANFSCSFLYAVSIWIQLTKKKREKKKSAFGKEGGVKICTRAKFSPFASWCWLSGWYFLAKCIKAFLTSSWSESGLRPNTW